MAQLAMRASCRTHACEPERAQPQVPLRQQLYQQRFAMLENVRVQGFVDVPNSYMGFRVGPVLLGCFLPPNVSPGPVLEG